MDKTATIAPGPQTSVLSKGPGAVRDPTAKLLAVLDFSAQARTPEALEESLTVLLLSLMGEFAAPAALVLLDDGDGGFTVRAAKGVGSKDVLGRRFTLEPDLLAGEARSMAELDARSPLRALAATMPLQFVVPVHHHSRALGLLGLAPRLSGASYSPSDLDLVGLVGSVAGTVVANHLLYDELRQANRKLKRHVFNLHTLFDLSRDLISSPDADTIYRILAQTAMAHVLVSQCVILMTTGSDLRVVFARGRTVSAEEEEILSTLAMEPPESTQATPPAMAEVVARMGLPTLIPLRAGTVTRGYLVMGPRHDSRALNQDDAEFLAILGNQAVTALDNLRLLNDRVIRERLERELGIAREIQNGLFPSSLPTVTGYALAGSSEPCFQVGGDYYDAVATPSGLILALGDVSGKSIPAALLMSHLQAGFRSLAHRSGETPASVLSLLNQRLFESTQSSRFASFFVAHLDPDRHRLLYSNGGHNPPLVLRASGEIERLTSGGPVLGIFDVAQFDQDTIELSSGDVVFLYTDGVTEAMDAREEEFGEDRLIECLRSLQTEIQDPAKLLESVVAEVREHSRGQEPADDLTVMAVTRL